MYRPKEPRVATVADQKSWKKKGLWLPGKERNISWSVVKAVQYRSRFSVKVL